MRRRFLSQSQRGRASLSVLGWVVVVAVGIGLVWFGFSTQRRPEEPEAGGPSPTMTSTTVPPTAAPSATPLPPTPTAVVPTATQPKSPLPTPTIRPTDTPTPVAELVAGVDGANVRSGPDLAYDRVGYLEPGESAVVTGRYEAWFRIDYDGASAWVYSGVATATNAEQVPEVELPASSAASSPGRAVVPVLRRPSQVA